MLQFSGLQVNASILSFEYAHIHGAYPLVALQLLSAV